MSSANPDAKHYRTKKADTAACGVSKIWPSSPKIKKVTCKDCIAAIKLPSERENTPPERGEVSQNAYAQQDHSVTCIAWMSAAPGQRSCVCVYGNPERKPERVDLSEFPQLAPEQRAAFADTEYALDLRAAETKILNQHESEAAIPAWIKEQLPAEEIERLVVAANEIPDGPQTPAEPVGVSEAAQNGVQRVYSAEQQSHSFAGAIDGIEEARRRLLKDDPQWPICPRMQPPYEAHGPHDLCPGLAAHPKTQIGR